MNEFCAFFPGDLRNIERPRVPLICFLINKFVSLIRPLRAPQVLILNSTFDVRCWTFIFSYYSFDIRCTISDIRPFMFDVPVYVPLNLYIDERPPFVPRIE